MARRITEATETFQADAGLAAHVAQYHLAHRDLDAAHAVLAPFVAAPPTVPRERQALAEALCGLARAHMARREIQRAAEMITQARLLAENPGVWRGAAAVAALQGDTATAQALWQRVVTAEPESGSGWLALARACEAAGNLPEAVHSYLRAAQVDPSHATILAVAERLAALAPARADLPPAPGAAVEPPLPHSGRSPGRDGARGAHGVRIAIIGSSTLDQMRGYLEVTCRLAGLVPEFYLGPFGQYAQDILDPDSPLYQFDPEVIIVAIHGRALFPDLYDNPFDWDAAARRAAADEVITRVGALLDRLTARTPALVLLHTFATPQYSPLGTLDLRDTWGQSALFAHINGQLAERVRHDFPSVHLVDEDRVYGRIGKRHVTDPRLWFLARMGIGEGALGALAAEYMRFIKALKGRARKCLVLDLDNTLWGGVVGEDGPHGIALGQEAPGNAYRAFQEAILSLWRRGIVLAINSKNNAAEALEVLEHHPDMVLRPSHFAAMRINWQDKATNLESIAAELNIGLDSMVLMDDNPAECALVRARLPEVLTVQLPRDPARYRSTLLELSDFDTLTLTAEDRVRGQLYAQRRERRDWEAAHADGLDAYLAELGLVVEVAPADEFALPRVAQLIGKTNQFNLTTRRHNEATVRTFAASAEHTVYSARVRDRFGDHGLVGTAIVSQEGDAWVVDTLLLSCRVLGRGVETAFLSALVAAAREGGARVLRGVFIPTAKNAPARDFYGRHGFSLTLEHGGTQHWDLDVRCGNVAAPPWLALHANGAVCAGT